MAEREYTRLTRSHVRSGFAVAVASRCSLWLGKDHLLLIDSNGYTETYKRFYFRDIQAFSLTLSNRRRVWNWILGISTGLCVIAWIADLSSNSRTPSVWGLITGILVTLLFAIPLLVNNLLGPTCSSRIKTAVQAEELSPLNRLSRARRVLARVRPLIHEAQRPLAPQTPAEKPTDASASPEIPADTAAVGQVEPGDDPIPPVIS